MELQLHLFLQMLLWWVSLSFKDLLPKALCLDRTLPGYHLHPGNGEGFNGWLIQLVVSLTTLGMNLFILCFAFCEYSVILLLSFTDIEVRVLRTIELEHLAAESC
ncbi:---NA--- [Olea europaea subsp. europaea]|uniref:Pectin acetylesterase n=1 Tax=Olea europaea subsp. europaea TaxID=158383 RepID=A0A8S0SKR7_OLEEU|nr:---NA--- [Olea europaea subsp. europaea]